MRNGLGLMFSILPFLLFSQKNMADYTGGWRGHLPDDHSLTLTIDLEARADQSFTLKVFHKSKELKVQDFILDKTQGFQLTLAEGIQLSGRYNGAEKRLDAFLQTLFFQYYLNFSANEQGHFTAQWNPWIVSQLIPSTIYLSVENAQGDQYQAYPFFDDARFPGTFADNFQKKADVIRFIDIKSGLWFSGKLEEKSIKLSLLFGEDPLFESTLTPYQERFPRGHQYADPSKPYTPPPKLDDGLRVGSIDPGKTDLEKLDQLADSIREKSLTYTHSVLISQNNRLVYEKYFYGYGVDIPHDTRSAQKSISSAMLGIAIKEGRIKDAQQPLYKFMPEQYQYTKEGDPLKSKIKLVDVLTMSSGLDAIDYGLDRQSAASEGAYQSTPDWTKTILEAPMINSPGQEANYGSGNPHLIGVVVNKVIDQPLAFYMNDRLFRPLGIDHYILQNDRSGTPYFGGGMYLSSRSLMKFGLLYLNKGVWNGRRILPQSWVKESFQKHSFLANDSDKNEYGYFWWHDTYQVGDKKIAAIEARGAGGQYIFVVPQLDMVVVITSGNYRNGRFWQPELIMEKYILPSFVQYKDR